MDRLLPMLKVNLLACKRDHSICKSHDLFRDDEGMTTVGMAVSMLLCLALVFSSAQLYQIESASSEIQEVADVAALAAENEVAEFMIAVRACDATVLSMTLLAATAFGVGVVCACIPFMQGISADLISTAQRITESRDRFADAAIDGLQRLQELLPFLSAASAAKVAMANNDGAMDANYFAVAVLLPQQQDPVDLDLGDGLATIDDEITDSIDDIKENSNLAEEKAEVANAAKLDAFMHDCGSAPGYCQYERADHLASLPSSDNPHYESVDAWSFSVALTRSQKYYKARQLESTPHGSVADIASYHLRKRFYSYVSSELSSGYVYETDDEFDCYFPKIFRNTAEFKTTVLYTERSYAVTPGGEGQKDIMHAYAGCPSAGSITGYDSISALDHGAYQGCVTCGFGVTSMGNIASASTNVQNGYEHHYEKIRAASEKYKKASQESASYKRKVKDDVNPILEGIRDLISEIGGKRIEVTPPGSDGAIALVVNAAQNATDEKFFSSFLSGGTTLGSRAAVSGATLVEDDGDDAGTVITSFLDSFGSDGGAAVGAARIVLDMWSGLLKAYERGLGAVSDAVTDVFDAISTNTASGLGSWASGAFEGFIDDANLEPANLHALKPAILNTGHIASASSGPLAVTYSTIKANAMSASSPTSDVFSGVIANMGEELTHTIEQAEFTIATIEFPIGDMEIPIKIALPQMLKDAGHSLIDQCVAKLTEIVSRVNGQRVWQ